SSLRGKVHESPAIMSVPLVILAIGSVLAGYLGIQQFLGRNLIAEWLAPVTAAVDFEHLSLTSEWLLIAASVFAAALGLGLGYWVYALNKGRLAKQLEPTPLTALSR